MSSNFDQFGQHATPQHAFAPSLETVANGDYDCEFVAAALDTVQGMDIARTSVRLSGNRTVEHLYWLHTQDGVNGFLAEMAALGFPAATWGSGPGKTVLLSVAIPACVAKLKGVKFRATKSSRVAPAKPASMGQAAQPAKTYHALHINGRITGAAMPTTGTSPGVTQAAVAAMAGAGVNYPSVENAGMDSDIPF